MKNGKAKDQHAEQRQADKGRHFQHDIVNDENAEGDDAPDQDADRIALILQGIAGNFGVAVEVAHPPDLGPGRIDAEGDHRQQDIDDPDAEILLPSAGEVHGMYRDLAWGRGVLHIHLWSPVRAPSQPLIPNIGVA
ncbi:MAG: hypothetical protein KDJ74_02535 [Notoacmeibacter sp.]|nr:hypothetical protein [Notoacmeibacter sp.]